MRRSRQSLDSAIRSFASVLTIVLTAVATMFTDRTGIGTWASVALVSLAYAVTERASVRLRIRDNYVSYVPKEFSLLIGALLLPPVTHVAIRAVTTAATSAWRVWLGRPRPTHPAVTDGLLGAVEVSAFTAVLALLGWQQNLAGDAPLLIGAAWVALQIPVSLISICAQRLSKSSVERQPGLWTTAVATYLSFQTMICALILGLTLLSQTRYVLLLFVLFIAAVALPSRRIAGLLIEGEEFRSVDRFFRLLQATDSTNVDAALKLAAQAVRARDTQLVILQREGPDHSLDTAMCISVDARTSSKTEDLPELWKEAIASRQVQTQVGMSSAKNRHAVATTQIACPLILKDQAVGLLVCVDQEERKVTDGAISMATRLAQHLSMWLEQDRLLGELRREMIERTREALHDPLTGLLNRRGFNEAWEETLRRGHAQLAVLLIDLDRFKDVNTHLGHAGGDELLVQVAQRLRKVAPPRSSVARLGGDEFAVIVPVGDHSSEGEAPSMTFARSVRRILEVEHVVGNESIVVGGSVGFALFPEHGHNLTTLLYNADAAMFAAKEDPDSGVVAHSEKLMSNGANGSNVADAYRLRSAIENRDIKVWYQPIINMQTYQIAGFEALARWQDGMSVVLPSEFISLAERTGHIHALTELVIHDAFSNTVRWRRQTGMDLHIAVNFSPLSISHPQALRAINETLEWTGLPAGAVHIEVTESRMFRDPDRALEQLDELKRNGLKISLDDFGTGHSTHEWLMRMAPDEIKIDRMFIRDIHLPRASGIVEVDVLLASKFAMTVVAEGIETSEQWLRARELGVDYGQGFLLGRPMPVEKVNRWLAAEHLEIHKLVERRKLEVS